ncbi:helix-turn-helix domain-containing protein [Muricauda ruestringensis]|uniref:helix-turn-helix domain-containing protein n=1 Tax=Flagellimonas ruestringensis TaxID=111501 RepID=UPI001CD23408|nr:helix-turn-helix domain-containing protein [Allomuricauda ruestringensis]MCA0960201.1 helix-turn-helix domain-containing protein [Allomuricauda ruestringensis]
MKSVQFISITPQELQEEILKGVQKQLEEFKKDLSKTNQIELLSRADVAKLLQIDLSTLYNWTKKGTLTSYGIGNRVYYKREEVESAIIRLN